MPEFRQHKPDLAASDFEALIAKHRTVDVLRWLHAKQRDISELSFETTRETRVPHVMFCFSDGYQLQSRLGTFRRLMRDGGLLKDADGQCRALFSLRHTYATQELLACTDIHTLARQMGTSVLMLERHYSNLTATLAADQLA